MPLSLRELNQRCPVWIAIRAPTAVTQSLSPGPDKIVLTANRCSIVPRPRIPCPLEPAAAVTQLTVPPVRVELTLDGF